MVEDGKAYKDRISVAEQNLLLFRKSVEQCNIPIMLDNSLRFIETIKNADNFYFNLPPNIQNISVSSFNKSQGLLHQYFEIKSRIGHLCECKTPK